MAKKGPKEWSPRGDQTIYIALINPESPLPVAFKRTHGGKGFEDAWETARKILNERGEWQYVDIEGEMEKLGFVVVESEYIWG